MKTFRNKHPRRSAGVTLRSDYKQYRDQLAIDFNNRCGYTDCSHRYWGVKFQIDHFAPQEPNVSEDKKQAFLDRKSVYENLVYTCPQVNRAKWNDWPSDDPDVSILEGKGYYDPCNEDFNEHFYRDSGGGIRPKAGDDVAHYMWEHLQLYLKRYELYWRFDKLKEKRDKLVILSENIEPSADSNAEIEILRLMRDFDKEIYEYEKYLDVNKNEIA